MNPDASRERNRPVILYGLVILALVLGLVWVVRSLYYRHSSQDFTQVMNVGKNYYDQNEAEKAVESFARAAALNPTHPDAHLNLANALLLAARSEEAIQAAQTVLKLDPNSAAAYFIIGCANLRLSRYEEAIQALQESTRIDPTVAAAFYQLGVAHQQLKQIREAIAAFEMAIALEPEHPAAHYNLSQMYVRDGRPEEAQAELETHNVIAAANPGLQVTPATYERSVHTQVRVPFEQEQPLPDGILVKYVDATEQAFSTPPGSNPFRGPAAVIDLMRDGSNDLFVREGSNSFRLLLNSNGVFTALGEPIPGLAQAAYTQVLIGDLDNDRSDDAIVLGPQGSHLFKLTTNGAVMEMTDFSQLAGLTATRGALLDLDFTGKLDLLALTPTNDLRVFRNLGGFYFKDITSTSGVPSQVVAPDELIIDDWNNDDLMDLFVSSRQQAPLFLAKQRGGPLTETNLALDVPSGAVLAVGDLNNDLRADLVAFTPEHLHVLFQGVTNRATLILGETNIHGLHLIDYDNDGWLDIAVAGKGLRIWRNRGDSGFIETTGELGLAALTGPVHAVTPADFDFDGDTDLLVALQDDELRLLRNDGGNANYQIKLRLEGNRSNASGLGIRIEVSAGGLRLTRTVRQLPIEIGVGKHQQLDAVTVRWFDLTGNSVDFQVDPRQVVAMTEWILPTGSCPYVYVWDGNKYRFVTDILGAAPAGLPISEGRYIEADPDEYVWIGNDTNVRPKERHYILQITEELREVLYLDEAKLIAVDHPEGTEVFPTDKLMPGGPFPPSDIVLLKPALPLLKAARSDGRDVTDLLAAEDGQFVSPVQLRPPYLRGLAEPYSLILDFGPLPVERPLILGITAWLRFGGGSANIAASQHPELPFPFPTLEVETEPDVWKPVDITFGAPAGKTKRMIVDLTGKLPPGSRRLRVTTAFEIHWDRISLMERADPGLLRITSLTPDSTDLHWRGYSEFEDLSWQNPLTPNYDRVHQTPPWRITPSGWCTRYGPVDRLINRTDDALALLNGGDELTLRFSVDRLPVKPDGTIRDFFLYSVGWDKDADFHVAAGTTVEPYPFHGMNDQLYGKEKRPVIDGDWWIREYNTRWVGPRILDRNAPRPRTGLTAKE